MKLDKISMLQCIRTTVNLVAILVLLWAIFSGPASKDHWQIVANTLILWFLEDCSLSMYLDLCYEREP